MIVMGVIMLLIGLCFLLIVAVIVFGERRVTRRATATTAGTVLREETVSDDDGTTSRYYVIRFEANGRSYETCTNRAGYDRPITPGDPMDVDYDPDDPKTCRPAVDRPDGDIGLIVASLPFVALTIGGAWIIATNIE